MVTTATRPTLPCVVCGEPFYAPPSVIAKGRKYCSMKCRDALKAVPPEARTCTHCGQVFPMSPSKLGKSLSGKVFCSLACRDADRAPPVEQHTCRQCGAAFDFSASPSSKARGLFCSRPCMYAHNQAAAREAAGQAADFDGETRTCVRCGISFYASATQLRKGGKPRLYCTKACAAGRHKKPLNEFTCRQCGAKFYRSNRQLRTMKFNGGTGEYCSNACSGAARKGVLRVQRLTRRCVTCGREFTLRRWLLGHYKGLFCSRQCAAQARSLGVEERTCRRCGKAFTIRRKDLTVPARRGLYCSRACQNATQADAKPRRTCLTCGKEFRLPPTFVRRGTRYCSHACYSASPEGQAVIRRPWNAAERVNYLRGFKTRVMPLRFPRVFKPCEQCGITFEVDRRQVPKVRAKRRFCSPKCFGDWQAAHPEATSFYIDGRGSLPYAPGWNGRLKRRILARDGYRCCVCTRGLTPGLKRRHGFAIHHIDWNKANHAPSNLISLCPSCHGRAHKSRQRHLWQLRLTICMAGKISGFLPAPSASVA